MIKFRIKELMEERGMKKPRYKPFTQRGISHDIVKRYFNGKKKDMGRDHMEIFCLVLRCTPDELVEWVNEENIPIDDAHPLHKIKPRKPFSLLEATKNMTTEEIRKKFEVDEKKKDDEEKGK